MLQQMNIKVCARVRPLSEQEKAYQCKSVVKVVNSSTIRLFNSEESQNFRDFAFDYTFSESADKKGEQISNNQNFSNHQMIFEKVGSQLLESWFQGYNCSILLYGESGSGKSYTMFGNPQNKGIFPNFVLGMLPQLDNETNKNKQFEISLSMFEIFNEEIHDLLSTKKQYCSIKQHKVLGLYIEGLSKKIITNSKYELQAMIEDLINRHKSSKQAVKKNYKVHTLIQIQLKCWYAQNGKLFVNRSFANLGVLADSQRVKGKIYQHSITSLATLGNVIHSLAQNQNQDKSMHVPYRDSKLTRILQNSLGGKCKTTMIFAISPTDESYSETRSTLLFAERTKRVKNNPSIISYKAQNILETLKKEKQELQKQIEKYEMQDIVKVFYPTESQVSRIQKKLEHCKSMISQLKGKGILLILMTKTELFYAFLMVEHFSVLDEDLLYYVLELLASGKRDQIKKVEQNNDLFS